MLDRTKSNTEVKKVTCAMCDMACQLEGVVENGSVKAIKADWENPIWPGAICVKAANAPAYYNHPDRLLHPLKRVGRRGSGEWERVSWDEALDDIAARITRIVDEHGPEAIALSSNSWNTSTESGAVRRFMNLLGSPNFISGVSMCAGNTAAVNRLSYGWFPAPDFENANLIVLGGHVPTRNNWSAMWIRLDRALKRGAKMIVIDPRRNPHVDRATMWLPIKPGSDAALYMGWIKTIIDEGLYDKDFVENWTTGLDALRERLEDYPLDRVAKLTGIDRDKIEESARMYATAGPAIIPWVPMLDKQINSTSAIRCQSIIRAICGYLDVPGGELLMGYNPDIPPENDYELHERLSQAQKDKQLRQGGHTVFTYEGMAALNEPARKVWGRPYTNLIHGSYMAHPPSVFQAMASGDPYPVKGFIVSGNNPLMSYANQQKTYEAILNQDLVVVHELFKTPTAQLADYILPADSWLERNHLHDWFGWSSINMVSHKLVEPPGECRGGYEMFKELAERLGFGDEFPWETHEDLYTERLKDTGMNWEEFSNQHTTYIPEITFNKYEETGFATPSGKVELYSSVLDDLGHDPLPYYRERQQPDDMPFKLFIGVRDKQYFHTAQRQLKNLRQQTPYPEMFMCPDDVRDHRLAEGDWYEVTSPSGSISLRLTVREDIPRGVVRVPRGWWIPEMDEGGESLSGAWLHADSILVPDTDDFQDREQGVVDMTTIPCKLAPAPEPEWVPRAKAEGFIKT